MARMRADGRALVSVVMPVYNSAEFLRASVSSALEQTWGDIELSCVDDGSTDESLAILEDLQRRDDRIKIVAFPFNRGVGPAHRERKRRIRRRYQLLRSAPPSSRPPRWH
jgi:glycosyltransferase involved in cell wall biosynthesis